MFDVQGLLGLWAALVIGYSTTTGITIVSVYRSDWQALAIDAVKRSEGATVVQSDETALLAVTVEASQDEYEHVSVASDAGSVNN